MVLLYIFNLQLIKVLLQIVIMLYIKIEEKKSEE